jgi:hypothetical protein
MERHRNLWSSQDSWQSVTSVMLRFAKRFLDGHPGRCARPEWKGNLKWHEMVGQQALFQEPSTCFCRHCVLAEPLKSSTASSTTPQGTSSSEKRNGGERSRGQQTPGTCSPPAMGYIRWIRSLNRNLGALMAIATFFSAKILAIA